MRGLNKLQIIGRLGRDPELRYTQEGKPVVNFSVATGGKWTDRNGNERDDTEWFRVEAWDRLAETCNQYLSKGQQVYIEGRIKTRKYTDRDGNERTSVEVVANTMLMLGGRDQGDQPEAELSEQRAPQNRQESQRQDPPQKARNQPQPVSSGDDEDDIPF